MLELQGFDVQGRDLDLALREVGEVPVLHDDEHVEEGDLRRGVCDETRRGDSVRVTQNGRRARTTQATKCRVNSVFPSLVQNGDLPTSCLVPLVSYNTSLVTS